MLGIYPWQQALQRFPIGPPKSIGVLGVYCKTGQLGSESCLGLRSRRDRTPIPSDPFRRDETGIAR